MSRSPHPRSLRPLFVVTVFVGSFLLFLVQPMVARLVLPTLGGSPNVWNTAMLFYQAALLVGYLYAHALSRLAVRAQWITHLALFAAAALTLPIGLARWYPGATGGAGSGWLLGLLAVSIGPLFLVVAAQAPLMQAWFARSGDRDAANPYFLYAASNAGSLLGLLCYPFVLEPLTRLPAQTALWSAGFALLAGLVGLSGWRVWRDVGAGGDAPSVMLRMPPSPVGEELPRSSPAGGGVGAAEGGGIAASTLADPPLLWRRRLRWVALAAVPSGLMLSTTTHITTDIMAMPLLWVLPLGLYLISFILVFGRHGATHARIAVMVAPVLLLLFGGAGLFVIGKLATYYGLASLALLFTVAVALHGALAADRPGAARLTDYYLWMSFGGMVGGLFCALLAPALFDWTYEHPLLLLAAALLLPARPLTRRIGRLLAGRRVLIGLPISMMLAWQVGVAFEFHGDLGRASIISLVAIIALFGVLSIGRRWAFAWHLLMLMLALGGWRQIDVSTMGTRQRSFFGIYTVETRGPPPIRRLLHGTTLHGIQSLEPAKALVPNSYYAPDSGVGRVMRAAPALFGPAARIGFVGLGAGTLACYASPGQHWSAYEIDPVIVRMAFDPGRFSFVSRCQPSLRVVVGDARLTLGREPARALDLLAVDAFSSDAIPLHLLTLEAFDVYARALAADGVLLVHVSNRFLALQPVVAAIAARRGWTARELVYRPSDADVAAGFNHSMSDWIALTRSPARMDALLAATGGDWRPVPTEARVSAWSDDYASILPTLKPLRPR